MSNFAMERLSDAPLYFSRITCECKIWRSRRNRCNGGYVLFRGTYPPGSAGTDDARYIQWLLTEFYTLYRPDGLVLDCRELDYVWGEDLRFPTPDFIKGDHFPLLVVLRPEQQSAFDYIVPQTQQRFDLLTALAEMEEAVRNIK